MADNLDSKAQHNLKRETQEDCSPATKKSKVQTELHPDGCDCDGCVPYRTHDHDSQNCGSWFCYYVSRYEYYKEMAETYRAERDEWHLKYEIAVKKEWTKLGKVQNN